MHLLHDLVLPTLLFLAPVVYSFESTVPAAGQEKRFVVYDAETVHYPFTVHLPDRTTRSLPALTDPPPLLLSLSGTGARGVAADAPMLSGYDGASRKIRLFNEGDQAASACQAAEEFLIVVPIAPVESDKAHAVWDVDALLSILTRVATMYEVDLSRVYVSGYSMGSRGAWNLMLGHPDIFVGAVISSGQTLAGPDESQSLLGIPIRNYIGTNDEENMDRDTAALADNYAQALEQAKAAGQVFNESRTLVNVPAIAGADHLNMSYRPWDDDVMTDGFAGALAWLLTQERPELANIPGLENAGYSELAEPMPAPRNASIVETAPAAANSTQESPMHASPTASGAQSSVPASPVEGGAQEPTASTSAAELGVRFYSSLSAVLASTVAYLNL